MVQTSRTVRVTIDASGAVAGAKRAKDALHSLTTSTKSAAAQSNSLASSMANSESALSRTARAANDNSRALDRVNKSGREASTAMEKLNGVIKTFIGLAAAKQVIDLADSFTRFTNALKVANVEGANQKIVVDRLYVSAQKYGVQLEAMGKLYGKAAQAQKSLNASQADLLKFTDGVAAALKVQGGGVNEAAGALHQLGQAITGNKIQAEEYNSILDGAYPILQAVAAGSDKYKGSVAALTRDVKAGNVTSKEFFDSFLKGSSVLEEKAAKANFTVAASWQVLSNAMTKYIGEADQVNAVTGTLGAGIRALGNNLDVVIPAVVGLGTALGVGFVVRAGAAAAAATGATTALGAMAIAARGAGAALLAAFGGPLGIAITAATFAVIGYVQAGRQATAMMEEQKKAADGLGIDLKKAADETNGTAKAANGAGGAMDGFRGKVIGLSGSLLKLATDARNARIELLKTQLAQSDNRAETFKRDTGWGIGQNASEGNAALKRRNFLEAGGKYWDAAVGAWRYGLSNGETADQAQKGYINEQRINAQLRGDLYRAQNDPLTRKDLPPAGDPPTGDPSKKNDGASEAERKAKAQKEFWEGLQRELELSKLTTSEAEKRRKEMELESITGQKIADIDKARLADGKLTVAQLVEQTKASEFAQQAAEAHRTRMIDLDTEQALLAKKNAGATEEQLAAERTALEFAASIKKANLALDEQTLATLTDQVRKEAERNAEIAKQNRLLAAGDAALSKYSSTYAARMSGQENADAKAGLDARLANGTITKAEYDEAMSGMARAATEAANQFKSDFASRINELGQQFGGKFGEQISKLGNALQKIVGNANGNFGGGVVGGIMGLIGKNPLTGKNNKLGSAFQDANQKLLDGLFSSNTWSKPLESLSKGFGDFKGDLHNLFGKGGDFTKGLGSVLGKAGAGADMGGTIAGLIGGDSTGGQVGGAIGSLALGPIGGIVGGLLGGIIGGLFKKTPMGSAVITGVNEGDMRVSGNKSSIRENLTTAGGSIQQGVQSVADAFGAMVGNFAVSIGQRGDYYRVSKSGSDAVGNKTYPSRMAYDVLYDGKDAETAIKIAIRDAIGDGALLGVSDFTKRIIANDPNLDRAVQIAKSYEDVLTALKASKDPVQAAVDAATKGIDQLITQMKSAGATASELANAEAYRADMLKKARDQETKGFTDFLETLNRSASGKSPLALLNEDLAKFREMEAKLAAGGTVDQNSFTDLANKVLGGAGDIYGSQTAAFQSIASELKTATEKALANTTAAFGADKTVTAIQDQTTQIVDQLQQMNYSLSQLASMGFGVSLSSTLNGQMLRTY